MVHDAVQPLAETGSAPQEILEENANIARETSRISARAVQRIA